jgi:pimeloyl-ACP methyl ester carboxylesterase
MATLKPACAFSIKEKLRPGAKVEMSRAMPQKKAQTRPAAPPSVSAATQSPNRAPTRGRSGPQSPPPTVSGRWLLAAVSIALLGAALCAWGALCLLFWQGSWQLLYHPTSAVTRTPAAVGLAFDTVAFASTESGEPRLKGWWITAAPDARFTVLYLHGQDGNLGDSLDALAALHALGLNVFAFDYRGYGQSQFQRPSEALWREDAEWALQYLTETRHIAAGTIILGGKNLGANLALELAAAHPELAGVVLESPLDTPMNAVFNDPRARLVPAHLLVRDRFDTDQAAAALKISSLWFEATIPPGQIGLPDNPPAFRKVAPPKVLVWLNSTRDSTKDTANALARWLDDLPKKTGNP